MAYIQMNLLSKSLMRTVPVNVILPADKMIFPGMQEREGKPYKTLYLLHGIFGNYTDWVNGTRIQRYAEEHDLVIVMPSGDNAFYVDQEASHNYYGEFIGKELVELTRKMFPLSHKREDTYIGGLSMGGYGAMRNGLKYCDAFGAIVALSGALLIEEMPSRTNDVPFFIGSRDYAESCFGNLDELIESDKNPKFLVQKLIEEGKKFPDIYIACGEEDMLLATNADFSDFLKQKGVNHTYVTGPGGHEWDFWDIYIKKGMEWLPTELGELGINSGNVGI
ncbi:MAG: alpha/beta hydrolase [Lachnospiraceae bacterium]